MISVSDNENMIVIKNSKFIGIIRHIDSVSDVDKYLSYAKDKYRDATHYCYAYIFNGVSKCSDDGEPSGTAGVPILQVLKMNNLNCVLCIVVRYFGKILLGASGLVRAYTKCTSSCLENHIVTLKPGYNISIKCSYDNIKKLDYLLRDMEIISKDFSSDVIYTLNVSCDLYKELISNNYDVKINSDIYL